MACVGLNLSAAVIPRTARAEVSAPEVAAVRTLWERAERAEQHGDWVECERALADAVAILETPGLRFHLAHCREQQNKWVEALVDYKGAQELLVRGEQAADVAVALPPAIETLEEKIPRLTVVVEPRPEHAALFVDGVEVSSKLLGRAIPLNPGGHTIELTSRSFDPVSRRVSLLVGERRELELVLTSDGSAAALQRGDVESPVAGFSAKPYVMIAEAVLALGAGSVSLYHTLAAHQAVTRAGELRQSKVDCATAAVPCESEQVNGLNSDLLDLERSRQSHNSSALLWAIGGGAAATSFFLTWVLWPDAAANHTSQLHWLPIADGGGVALSGVF